MHEQGCDKTDDLTGWLAYLLCHIFVDKTLTLMWVYDVDKYGFPIFPILFFKFCPLTYFLGKIHFGVAPLCDFSKESTCENDGSSMDR